MTAVLINAALFAGLALVIGAVSIRYLVLPRCGLSVSERSPASHIAATSGAWGAALILVAAPARLLLQAAELADPGEPWMPLMRVVIVSTTLGKALQLQAIWAAAALMAFSVARTGRDRGWKAAVVAASILAFTPGLSGHAAASSSPLLALAASTTHVLSMGIWIGALFHLRRVALVASDATLALMLKSFHAVAIAAVLLLALSGSYHVWTLLGAPSNLLTTSWGRLLGAKLLLVLAVLGMGYRHWRGAEASVSSGERVPLGRSLQREINLAAAVLVLTAILTTISTPE